MVALAGDPVVETEHAGLFRVRPALSTSLPYPDTGRDLHEAGEGAIHSLQKVGICRAPLDALTYSQLRAL